MTRRKPCVNRHPERIVVRGPARTEGQLRLEWDKALELMRKHIGKRVIYGSQEFGVITGIDGRWVMVRFGDFAQPIKVCPVNLRLAARPVADTTSPLAAAGSTPP